MVLECLCHDVKQTRIMSICSSALTQYFCSIKQLFKFRPDPRDQSRISVYSLFPNSQNGAAPRQTFSLLAAWIRRWIWQLSSIAWRGSRVPRCAAAEAPLRALVYATLSFPLLHVRISAGASKWGSSLNSDKRGGKQAVFCLYGRTIEDLVTSCSFP